jgi:hypothetical protein
MGIWRSISIKLGFADLKAGRAPITVFLLEDDERRHRWFRKKFVNDEIDITDQIEEAKDYLQKYRYDAIFLDHDLIPEHYKAQDEHDDERTGIAIAFWLAENPQIQPSALIIVHTRNADGALRMVEKLREAKRQVEYVPFPLLGQRLQNYWKDLG